MVLGPNICLLVLGEFTQPDKDLVFRYRGTVALIQDAGLNILVDSGSANSKNKLIAGLDRSFRKVIPLYSGRFQHWRNKACDRKISKSLFIRMLIQVRPLRQILIMAPKFFILDHMGNDNLFPYAQKFFAGSVYKGDEFLPLQQLEVCLRIF